MTDSIIFQEILQCCWEIVESRRVNPPGIEGQLLWEMDWWSELDRLLNKVTKGTCPKSCQCYDCLHGGQPPMILGNQTRCTSISAESKIQCGLPGGHKGNHQNGMAIRTWTDSEAMHPANVADTQKQTINLPEASSTRKVTFQTEEVSKLKSLHDPAATQIPCVPALSISPLTIEEVIMNLERSKRELEDINQSLTQTLSVLRSQRGIKL